MRKILPATGHLVYCDARQQQDGIGRRNGKYSYLWELYLCHCFRENINTSCYFGHRLSAAVKIACRRRQLLWTRVVVVYSCLHSRFTVCCSFCRDEYLRILRLRWPSVVVEIARGDTVFKASNSSWSKTPGTPHMLWPLKIRSRYHIFEDLRRLYSISFMSGDCHIWIKIFLKQPSLSMSIIIRTRILINITRSSAAAVIADADRTAYDVHFSYRPLLSELPNWSLLLLPVVIFRHMWLNQNDTSSCSKMSEEVNRKCPSHDGTTFNPNTNPGLSLHFVTDRQTTVSWQYRVGQ